MRPPGPFDYPIIGLAEREHYPLVEDNVYAIFVDQKLITGHIHLLEATDLCVITKYARENDVVIKFHFIWPRRWVMELHEIISVLN